MATLRERFEAKFERLGPDECWPWGASLGSHGYGQLAARLPDGRRTVLLAHRVAYEMYVGPIPEGAQVDHVATRGCTVRHCVNPAHLEAVSQRENLRRQLEAGRVNTTAMQAASSIARRARTHCKHGHPLDGENKGRRYCRTCKRRWQREGRRRRHATSS